MTQEQKDLLLKDLCARLPYGVEVEYNNINCEVLSVDIFNKELTIRICNGYCPNVKLEDVKPYLFPFSSMTEKQEIEFINTCTFLRGSTFGWTDRTFDWLNKNHFDYRGLIPMGLANDATNLNIY